MCRLVVDWFTRESTLFFVSQRVPPPGVRPGVSPDGFADRTVCAGV